MQAFEAMLQRHGAAGVGVNAVLGTASVGKRLLYKYFGDLNGLAKAWARDRRDPLDLGRRMPVILKRLRGLPASDRVAAVLEDFATRLRKHPWALQVLLADLLQPAPLGNALQEIRLEIGVGHEQLLIDSGALLETGSVQRALMLHATATYLALRSRFAPDYNGLDLASDRGWKAAMAMLRGFGHRPAARPRRRVSTARR